MAQNSCEKVKKYEKLREHDISQLLVFRAQRIVHSYN